DDVAGGAATLGHDWHVISEEEKEKTVDPRLAGLAKFFDK
ncbi:DUF177 domain-containing protein, partial [Bacillus cereus]|nr:DUF177 domain-containing protein [Bacillus cereus]